MYMSDHKYKCMTTNSSKCFTCFHYTLPHTADTSIADSTVITDRRFSEMFYVYMMMLLSALSTPYYIPHGGWTTVTITLPVYGTVDRVILKPCNTYDNH